jgi:hypothetical protein
MSSPTETVITITSTDTKFLLDLINFLYEYPKVEPGSVTISFNNLRPITNNITREFAKRTLLTFGEKSNATKKQNRHSSIPRRSS